MAVTVGGAHQPYPVYKPSDTECIGLVPEHWDVVRLSSVSQTKSIVNQQDRELLSVYLNRGVIRFSDVVEKRANPTSHDVSHYQAVDPGDFVLNNQQAWRGSVGVSDLKGIVSPAYLVLSVSSKLDPQFADLLLRAPSMVDQYVLCSKGVGTIQRNLYWPHLKRMITLVPPIVEQVAIVRYLDYVDRRIRRYVSAKRKLITLLEEEKQAVINQAVTRSLDPNVRLKPSGVEWLGDIPTHWEVRRLKSSLLRNDSGVWGDEFDERGTIVLRSTEQTVTGEWRITRPARIRLSVTQRSSALLEAGDLVITKSSGSEAHIGKTSLVDQEIAESYCCFSNFMQRIRLDDSLDPAFMWYILNTTLGREQLILQSTTTTGLGNLNGTIIGNCYFAIPPLAEQHAVVVYLDKASTGIDTTIARARRQIELVEEYRTRLIADVVTGKLDVREAAARLPDEAEDADGTEEDHAAEDNSGEFFRAKAV